MPRVAALAALGACAVLAVSVPAGVVAALGVPMAVGAVVALLAASYGWAHPTEEKGRGLAPPLLVLTAIWAAIACGIAGALRVDTLLDYYVGDWAALGVHTFAETAPLALAGILIGWVLGGLAPGSGWHRAGRPWRKGE